MLLQWAQRKWNNGSRAADNEAARLTEQVSADADLLAQYEIFRFECAPLTARSSIIELAHDTESLRQFVEGTLAATEDALREGWSGNLAGGASRVRR